MTSYQVMLSIHILFMLLLFQVNIFFCDLNFLYDYSISRGFIFAMILESRKTRN